jgi:hypothetical protein
MTARASTSSGPKPDLEPTGPQDVSHPVAYAILSGIAVGLLLLVIGLLSDTLDTYFNAIGPASLLTGTTVALFVWRRERQALFVRSHGPRVHSFESSYEHADPSNLRPKDVSTPEPKHLVPFGPYGAGQWTGHPIGLVIVIGLVLMGLISRTPLSDLIFFSLLGGAVVGMFLWLYHR